MQKLTFLIVDDDESSLIYLREILKGMAKEFLLARNGEEAVDICRNNKTIDIVLMDIKLPKLDGYEATRKIREFNKEIIIIGQTAYALTGDRQKVMEAGCNDYISKPIYSDKLFAVINKQLNNRKSDNT